MAVRPQYKKSNPSTQRSPASSEIDTENDVEYDDEIDDDRLHSTIEEEDDDKEHDANKSLPEKGKIRQPKRMSLMPSKPRAKIDAFRLLGDNGFRVLLKNSKSLKFKGKGHEFQDLDILISFYKDWCHGLFPKYPFKDVVKIVEKQCRKKELHIQMDKWFGEFKDGRDISHLQMPSFNMNPSTLLNFNPTQIQTNDIELPTYLTNPTSLEPTDHTPTMEQNEMEQRRATALKILEEKRKLSVSLEEKRQSEDPMLASLGLDESQLLELFDD